MLLLLQTSNLQNSAPVPPPETLDPPLSRSLRAPSASTQYPYSQRSSNSSLGWKTFQGSSEKIVLGTPCYYCHWSLKGTRVGLGNMRNVVCTFYYFFTGINLNSHFRTVSYGFPGCPGGPPGFPGSPGVSSQKVPGGFWSLQKAPGSSERVGESSRRWGKVGKSTNRYDKV